MNEVTVVAVSIRLISITEQKVKEKVLAKGKTNMNILLILGYKLYKRLKIAKVILLAIFPDAVLYIGNRMLQLRLCMGL